MTVEKKDSASDRPEVLVVTKLWPPMMEALQRSFRVHDRVHETDPAAFAAVAPRIRAIAATGESKVGREMLAHLPALELISVFGVGYDGIDVEACRERGVAVTHTPNVLNDEVADLAIALVLAVARRLPQADRYVREGRWREGPAPLGRKVSGARLGIVGLGRIGQAIARRAEAFGMSIAYTARNPRSDAGYRYLPDAGGAGRRGRFPRRHHARGRRHAQADRCPGARSARAARLSRQRRTRLGGRRGRADRCAAGRHHRRCGARCIRAGAARAGRALRARQRGADAAHRQRDRRDTPGDGGPRLRQPGKRISPARPLLTPVPS